MSDEVDNGQMKKEWFRVPTVVQQIETPRSTDPIMRPCADREEKRVTHGATTTGKESRRSLTSNPNQRSLPGADRPGPLDLDVVEANEERVDAFQTTPSSAARISESNRFERNFLCSTGYGSKCRHPVRCLHLPVVETTPNKRGFATPMPQRGTGT